MAVINATPTMKSKETRARKASSPSLNKEDNNKRLKVSPLRPPPLSSSSSSSCGGGGGGGGGFSSALSVLLSKSTSASSSSTDDDNVNDTEGDDGGGGGSSGDDRNNARMATNYKYTGGGFQSANSFMLNNTKKEEEEEEEDQEQKQKQNRYSSDYYDEGKQQVNNNNNNNNDTSIGRGSTCNDDEQEHEPHDMARNNNNNNNNNSNSNNNNSNNNNGIISINIKINGIKYYMDSNDRNDIIRDIFFSQSSSSSSNTLSSSERNTATTSTHTSTSSTSTGSATTVGGRQRKEIILLREPNNEHDPNAIKAVMVVSAADDDDIVGGGGNDGTTTTTRHHNANINRSSSSSSSSTTVEERERRVPRVQGEQGGVKIGYVQANRQATILAPLIDQGHIEFLQVNVIRLLKTKLHLRVTLKISQFNSKSATSMAKAKATVTSSSDVLSSSSEDSGDSLSQQKEEAYHHYNYLISQLTTGESFNDSRINVQQLVENNKFAQRDLLQSYSSPYTIQDLTARLLPWNPMHTNNNNINGNSISNNIVSRRRLQQQQPRRRKLHHHQQVTPPAAPATTDTYSKLEHGWLNVNDASSSSSTTTTTKIISYEEKKAATARNSWPPTDEILAKLGLGSGDDTKWWQETAGLLPPCQWHVTGAYDLVGTGTGTGTKISDATARGGNKPHVASVSSGPASVPLSSSGPPVLLQSREQVQRTCDVLDGAVHGVTNVWTDQTLEEISDLMHTEHFWLNRKGESFIKVYGGSYVLGQKVDDMQLVLGATHQALTDRICCAHNLIYTVIHLENPAAPGFNTLIFGLNLSGSGFHYHQDSIPNLKGKNAPLLPEQPVVTTVLYENIQEDSGKECVFWKPIFNFTPRSSSSIDSDNTSKRNEGLYLAARACPTQHGQMHIQRAGLQKDTLHGIFHTPLRKDKDDDGNDNNDDEEEENGPGRGGPRTGYRVAITARICHSNSNERLVPYLGSYNGVLGPKGNLTLPRNLSHET